VHFARKRISLESRAGENARACARAHACFPGTVNNLSRQFVLTYMLRTRTNAFGKQAVPLSLSLLRFLNLSRALSRPATRFLLRFQESHTAPAASYHPPSSRTWTRSALQAASTPSLSRVRLGNENRAYPSPGRPPTVLLSLLSSIFLLTAPLSPRLSRSPYSLSFVFPSHMHSYIQERDWRYSFPRKFLRTLIQR